MTNPAAGTPVPPCYTAGRAFTSSRVPRRNRSTRVDTHSHNLASAVCTPNSAQIRPGSNLTRSFVNASSKCSDAGLGLARSYEFAERLEFLSVVEERNKEARLIIEDAD
jgi:hypothetical protein